MFIRFFIPLKSQSVQNLFEKSIVLKQIIDQSNDQENENLTEIAVYVDIFLQGKRY